MRIHHSDNSRKEETRRDEVRRREVPRDAENVRSRDRIGSGGQLIRTECVELTIMLLDTHFMDLEKSNERMFNFFKITWKNIWGVLVS
jgi:hypothetical protein